MPDLLPALVAGALAASLPLAVTALGGLFTEAAGSLSVALEGCMLAGAFAAAAAGQASGSLWVGLLAALLAGLALASIVGGAAGFLGADVFVAGLAANLLAPGAISMISGGLFGTKGVVPAESLHPASLDFAAFAGLPLAGRALLAQDPCFLILAAAAAVLAATYSFAVFGLRIRAAGHGGEVARAAGIQPGRYKMAAHLVAGGAAGLSGAALAASVAAFVPGISAGRGWIALVAIYLGGKRPAGVLLACLCFGLLIAASNAAQGFGSAPPELLQALPYAATGLALALWKRAERRG
jgi:general nucleoside transport system permease protein